MTQETNDLLKKALALPDEDRAVLAGVLIDSLDPSTESSPEEAWNQEIARRVEELDSGKAKTIPWDEVRHRIEAIGKSRR